MNFKTWRESLVINSKDQLIKSVMTIVSLGAIALFSGYGDDSNKVSTLPLNPLCEEVSRLTCQVAPDAKNVLLSLDTGDTGTEDKRMKASCVMLSNGQQLPHSATLSFNKGKASGILPMPLPGEYEVLVTFFLDGKEYFKLHTHLTVPAIAGGLNTVASPDILLKEKSKLGFEIDPDTQTALVRLDVGAAKLEDSRLQGQCAIVPKGMNLPGKTFPLNFAAGKGSCVIPLPPLTSPSEYEVIVLLMLDGKKNFEFRKNLTIPTTEWLGNKIGLEDKVLPPWTPMTVQGNTVGCWGREYRFDNGALPTRIVSAGKELLARPVLLRATQEGKELHWKLDQCKIDYSSPTRVKMSSRIESKYAGFDVRVTTEYDGLALFEITAALPDGLPLDTLSLEIPVKTEHALYRYLFDIQENPLPGNVPEGEGVVQTRKWTPFAWLGDNDRGLFWFCESDEMWPNRTGNAMEIVRSGKELILRFNILVSGQKLPPKWKLVFGLQATPVKLASPRDTRGVRFWGPTQNVDLAWPTPKVNHSTKGFGYPEALDPQAYAKYVKSFQDKGVKVTPYLGITFVSDGFPETTYFKKKWFFGFDDPSISQCGWNYNWYCVSPVGEGYADFITWKTKEFMERYKLDGVYHDQSHPYICDRQEAGVGYERDGVRYPTYSVLGYRNLYRRIYAVVKSLPRKTFMLAHPSAKLNIPVLAYEDAFLEGEHPFAALVRSKSYMEVMTLDTFRAGYMGRQWGIAPFFLPEFRGEMEKALEPTRELMGLLMVHDVTVCRLFCNRKVVDETHRALDEFGYVDSDFIPYFDPVPPATTDMKDVYISAYKRADGRVLLIAANLSKEKQDQRGKVRINAERIGLPLNKVASWPDKQTLEAVNGEIQLAVPRMGHRMIVIGNLPEKPAAVMIDTDSFSGWALVDAAQQQDKSGKYLKVSDKTVNISAVDKAVEYFNIPALPVLNGGQVEFSFKAEGSGQGEVGFFAYSDDKWTPTEGTTYQKFTLTATPKEYKFTLPVKGDKIKSVRVLIGASPNSNAKYSELKIEGESETKKIR
jgi:hypothetical protein